jgi:hypothetical protein
LGGNWGGRKAKIFLTLKEYTALISYVFPGLFHSQDSPELNSPAIANIIQKAEQYGQQPRLRAEALRTSIMLVLIHIS